MAADMEFCLLGPLLVRRGGVDVPVPQAKQRAVLAALLLNANRIVSVEELAEVLWGSAPPPSARVTIQNYVRRLRHALGETAPAWISTQPRGYLTRVAAGEMDVSRFEDLLGSARTAARDSSWARAGAQARAALSLWRGEALEDVESELLTRRDVARLTEMRLQALELRIEADLRVGSQADVIAELQRLADAQPLREHLHALLMLALYRCARQAEALAAYRRAWQMLVDELGVEPGAELQELHQRMLAHDSALTALIPAGTRGAIDPARPEAQQRNPAMVPRQLPTTVRHFTGRAAELAALTSMREGFTGLTVVISAIAGTAGVGKTALAVQWAHQVADRFPDGQLYVNLRGFDPGRPGRRRTPGDRGAGCPVRAAAAGPAGRG
ncbi:MAG TPA: AfsR/SARP family transcriptional regulator [Streptosporangiaceae bacterium]